MLDAESLESLITRYRQLKARNDPGAAQIVQRLSRMFSDTDIPDVQVCLKQCQSNPECLIDAVASLVRRVRPSSPIGLRNPSIGRHAS